MLTILEQAMSDMHISLGGFSHREWRYPQEREEQGIVPLIDHRFSDDKKMFVDLEFVKDFMGLRQAD